MYTKIVHMMLDFSILFKFCAITDQAFGIYLYTQNTLLFVQALNIYP